MEFTQNSDITTYEKWPGPCELLTSDNTDTLTSSAQLKQSTRVWWRVLHSGKNIPGARKFAESEAVTPVLRTRVSFDCEDEQAVCRAGRATGC
jgi:hypothetical protein